MVALNFNAQTVAPNTALEPIPSGTYPAIITGSEEKPTSKGDGHYLQIEYTIQGGQYNGRKLNDRLNIKNPSPKAVEIAYGTLSAICHVTNRLQIQDSAQLHGAALQIVVAKVQRDDKPGEYSNDIKGYKDVNGNDPGKAGAAPQGGQPSPQGGAAPAWAAQQAAPAPQPSYQQQMAPQPPQYAPQQPQYAPQPPMHLLVQPPIEVPQQMPPQQAAPQGQPAWAQQPQGQQPVQQPVQQNGQPAWAQQPPQQPPQQMAPAPQEQAPQQYAPAPGATPPWGNAGAQA